MQSFKTHSAIWLIWLMVGATMVMADHHQGGNPEWKKLSYEIQEKVCSGKTTEAQLNDLRSCIEDLKSQNKDRERLDEDVQDCLQETETDIGFTVDENHKESVYMICSGKFRMCMRQKLKNRPNTEENQEMESEKMENDSKPRLDDQKIQILMDCKRNALEL